MSGPEPPPPPRVLADRYEFRRWLGQGGCADVFEATDLATGGRVAVKLIRPELVQSWPRVRREVLALRLLRLPGIVQLLDEGTEGGVPYLVMEVVSGSPFPGLAGVCGWDALAPRALALLECIGRVHAAGVVHRDLKPSNVLVDEEGRVTIVDFGLSWGVPLGEQVTMVGTVVGTPEYVAPELIGVPGGDARTDLYSIGVMLYRALSGRGPHEAHEFAALVAMKQHVRPAPLHHLAPSVPRRAAEAIDRMLAIEPADRPQSAGEAIAAIFGGAAGPTADRTLPRLGGTEVLERVVARLRAGEAVDVGGPPGCGTTRLLTEAADVLGSEGREVRWAVSASGPYASLAPVVGPLDGLGACDPADVRSAVRARVEDVLRSGAVVVADDPGRIDRRSAEVLEACRGAGRLLRVVARPGPGAVVLGPLAEEDLWPLFRGPDRIFHLREDGARELWHRTGGFQARVAAESAAWVRAGLATRDSGRLVVTRESLARLRGGLLLGEDGSSRGAAHAPRAIESDDLLAWITITWPDASRDLLAAVTRRPAWRVAGEIEDLEAEGAVRRLPDGRVQPLAASRSLPSWHPDLRRAAHVAISRVLAPGTPSRLRHLAAAEESGQVIEEALLRAPALVREGRAGDALVVLEIALGAARSLDDAEAEERVLVALAVTSHAGGFEPSRLRRALYEIGRARRPTIRTDAVRVVLETALRSGRSDPSEVIESLDSVAGLVPGEFEVVRQIERGRAGMRLPGARADAIVAEFANWAATARHPGAQATVCSMHAIRARARGDFEESARLHLRAASLTDRVTARVNAQSNAAIVLLDAGRVAEARDVAARGCDDAAACRLPAYEATFWSILREVRYREGAAGAPDAELAEAAALLDDPDVAASILLTEAAIAWRAGDLGDARRWADESSRLASRDDAALLARSLAFAAGGAGGRDGPDAIRAALRNVQIDADVAAQVLGLLALRADDPAALRRDARARLGDADWGDWDARRTVLSLRECVDGIRIAR